MPGKMKDYTGRKFGKLTVIKFVGFIKNGTKRNVSCFECLCDCGNIINAKSNHLIAGYKKSCGCLKVEQGKKRRLPNEQALIYELYIGYKRNAKTRNVSFNLSLDEFKELIFKPCFICGIIANNSLKKTKNRILKYNGIDRIDNNEHYIKNNVQPCCFNCNRAKNKLSLNDFLKWINRIYNYQRGFTNEK